MKETPILDFRQGECFYRSGKDIRLMIQHKLNQIVQPSFEKCLLALETETKPLDAASMAALLLALHGDKAELSSKALYIQSLCGKLSTLNKETINLKLVLKGLQDDVSYVLNKDKLLEYGFMYE